MKILVKRIYDPKESSDGQRALVDRLWPRGISKEKAKIDLWLKEITPSNELRSWFHENKAERYQEFTKKYRNELQSLSKDSLKELKQHKTVTLVTAVKDIEHSHVPVLRAFLEKL